MAHAKFRQVIPSGYRTGLVTYTGTSPYLMRGSDVDPESDEFRAFKLAAAKRGKTEEDDARLRRLEWSLSLDLDPEIGPYVPARYLKENIREAATAWSKGEAVIRSLVVVDFRIALDYDGPRDEQGLWDAGFRFSRLVVNNGRNRGAVYRTRPRFDEWTFSTTIAWDPEELNDDLVGSALERAQRYGLGDARRIGYGAFVSSFAILSANGGGVRSDARRGKDPSDDQAHRAKVREVTGRAGQG